MQRYLEKISGPLLDRIDLIVEVPRIPHDELRSRPTCAEADEAEICALRESIQACRTRQLQRSGKLNSDLDIRELERVCMLNPDCEVLLQRAVKSLGLSARACHRVLKIARTIADLEQREEILVADLSEAIAYRRHARLLKAGA